MLRKWWIAFIVIGLWVPVFWKVKSASVTEAVPPTAVPGVPSGEQVVRDFFNDYIVKLGAAHSFLADRSYRNSAYLSADFIQALDEMLSTDSRVDFDPILCARDVPPIVSFRVDSAAPDEMRVAVRESWPDSFQDVMVRVEPSNSGWKIAEVTCPLPDTEADSPTKVVSVFFNWYTQYARYLGNPLLNRAFQNGSLSETLARDIEVKARSVKTGTIDPVLLTVDLPEDFDVELEDADEVTAVVAVHELFSGHQKDLLVTLKKNAGRWEITEIVEDASAEALTVVSGNTTP